MTLSEKIVDLARKGYTVRFQATEIFPDNISITLFETVGGRDTERRFETTVMNCEYGIPPEEEIVNVLSELEMRIKEA